MKTAEEILAKHDADYKLAIEMSDNPNRTVIKAENALKAMEEYAAQPIPSEERLLKVIKEAEYPYPYSFMGTELKRRNDVARAILKELKGERG